jgi:probable rRNA maturation factor
MFSLEVEDDFSNKIEPAIIERAIRLTFEHETISWEDNSLTLVITGDNHIESLNKEYRGITAPTDVLSFPTSYPDPDSGTNYLGDVLISFPRAVAQAAEVGHLVDQELQLLVVHGVLHLLGHDHVKTGEGRKMWAAQAEILDKLGIQIDLSSNFPDK